MSLIGRLLLISLLILSQKTYAQDFAFSLQQLRGTGCPKGSNSTVVSPDGSALSVIFDRFSAVVPNDNTLNDNDEEDNDDIPKLGGKLKNNKNLSRKACNISLVATIPPEHKILGLDITTDVRGISIMEEGTEGRFQSIFVGKKGLGHKGGTEKNIVGQKVWRAKMSDVIEDWTFSKNHFMPLSTGCAKKQDRKIQLNLKTVLMARILDPFIKLDPRGEVIVDSSDIMGSLRVKVHTQVCKK